MPMELHSHASTSFPLKTSVSPSLLRRRQAQFAAVDSRRSCSFTDPKKTPLKKKHSRAKCRTRERRKTVDNLGVCQGNHCECSDDEDRKTCFLANQTNDKQTLEENKSLSHDGYGIDSRPKNKFHLQLMKFWPPNYRSNKSPSDLDADDEDNEDYDSASIISTSENNLNRLFKTKMEEELKLCASPSEKTMPNQNMESDFQAKFKEIRITGMRALQKSESSSTSAEDEIDLISALEKERKEKAVLIQKLSTQECKMQQMTKTIGDLNQRVNDLEKQSQNPQK